SRALHQGTHSLWNPYFRCAETSPGERRAPRGKRDFLSANVIHREENAISCRRTSSTETKTRFPIGERHPPRGKPDFLSANVIRREENANFPSADVIRREENANFPSTDVIHREENANSRRRTS